MGELNLKNSVAHLLMITIVFMLGGSLFGFWHLWVLYLVPPIVIYTQTKDSDSYFVRIYQSFFIAATAFLAVGSITDIWHPTWLVFLLPVIFYLKKD